MWKGGIEVLARVKGALDGSSNGYTTPEEFVPSLGLGISPVQQRAQEHSNIPTTAALTGKKRPNAEVQKLSIN